MNSKKCQGWSQEQQCHLYRWHCWDSHLSCWHCRDTSAHWAYLLGLCLTLVHSHLAALGILRLLKLALLRLQQIVQLDIIWAYVIIQLCLTLQSSIYNAAIKVPSAIWDNVNGFIELHNMTQTCRFILNEWHLDNKKLDTHSVIRSSQKLIKLHNVFSALIKWHLHGREICYTHYSVCYPAAYNAHCPSQQLASYLSRPCP